MLMYGCYRKDDASNPEVFLTAASAILAEYSDEVIRYVTDPRTGLPSNLKWPPQASEVREACKSHASYLARIDKFANERRYEVPNEPIFSKVNRLKQRYISREVLADGIEHAEFLLLAKDFPPGSEFVGALRRVYAPERTPSPEPRQ